MIASPILGIIGGMGPLVTAEFLQTIYKYSSFVKEQDAPNVIIYSLSSTPDRTENIDSKDEQRFIDFIAKSLTSINQISDVVVIACCTAHYFLPKIPKTLQSKIISLIDITRNMLVEHHKPALLLATSGTYKKRIFHDICKNHIISLSEEDQKIVHNIIYDVLKKGKDPIPVIDDIRKLLLKYHTSTFISGCTEFHFVAKAIKKNNITDIFFIDPLDYIAKNFKILTSEFSNSSLFT